MGSKLPLDDTSYLTRLDPKGMLALTQRFPEQVQHALEIVGSTDLRSVKTPRCAIVAGMGGSAAGGDLAAALANQEGFRPLIVSRHYSLPHWVGGEDLVIVASYSGNTEESLASFEDARSKGVPLAAVTSGGELAKRARADSVPLVTIPSGQPPRTALGYMLVPLLAILEKAAVLPAQRYGEAIAALNKAVEAYGQYTSHGENTAKQIAAAMFGKLACLYGLGEWQGAVAGRWRAQINENSKNLAISHTFPELNHNEILGWVEAGLQNANGYLCVRLEDDGEPPKMKARGRVTANLIQDRADTMVAKAEGTTVLAKMLNLCLLGDFVSLYLAALNGVDPESIDWINALKAELSKID